MITYYKNLDINMLSYQIQKIEEELIKTKKKLEKTNDENKTLTIQNNILKFQTEFITKLLHIYADMDLSEIILPNYDKFMVNILLPEKYSEKYKGDKNDDKDDKDDKDEDDYVKVLFDVKCLEVVDDILDIKHEHKNEENVKDCKDDNKSEKATDDKTIDKKQTYRTIKNKINVSEENVIENDIKVKEIENIFSELISSNFSMTYKKAREEIDDLMESLKTSKMHTKVIKNIMNIKHNLLSEISIEKYIEELKIIVNNILDITKKRDINIHKIYITPLDARLISYNNYHKQSLTTDDIHLYRLSRKISMYKNSSKRYIPFNYITNQNNLHEYSVAIMNIKDILKTMFVNPYGFNNIIYIKYSKDDKDDDKDPYSFYTLQKIESGKRYWILNNRLEELGCIVSQKIRDICIDLMNKIHYDVFNDNIYRENPTDFEFISSDFKQIINNLYICTKWKLFCKIFQNIIIKKCTVKITEVDLVNLTSDDKMAKKKFNDYIDNDTDFIYTMRDNFKDITDEGIQKYIMNSRKMLDSLCENI